MVRSSWNNGPFHPLFQKALSTPQWQLERAGAQAIGQRRSDFVGQRLALQFARRFLTGSGDYQPAAPIPGISFHQQG